MRFSPRPFLGGLFGGALLSFGCVAAVHAGADTEDITVHGDAPGVAVSPTLYGAFFEDINRAGDGGLYAELLQNRSFEDHPAAPLAWTPLENPRANFTLSLDRTHPLNATNPTSLKLVVKSVDGGRVGVFNQGFKGIPTPGKSPDLTPRWRASFEEAQRRPANGLAVRAGVEYVASLSARATDSAGPLAVSLETPGGEVLAKQTLGAAGADWQKFAVRLTPVKSDDDARLVIAVEGPGTLWLDMVSLFPAHTFEDRANGLRADLAQTLADLHPGLLRFPGGSFSEGAVLGDAWQWKETIGDPAARRGTWNIWGYRSTNGLGFHEYLQLAEDLGAEPLYVVHIGMAERGFVPLDQLEPWIQDMVDAIEYANGPADSGWGALRAKNGHPAPFGLKYVELGNENGMGYSWGGGDRADYLPRYRAFYERLKATDPHLVAIANIHTEPDVPADVVDEHYYDRAEWFFQAATRYDHYDRSKPKLYLGEYAAKNDGGHGNMREALGEAAFLTGLERNADVVLMSSLAPLFTNPPWEKWKPSAIVFDPTHVYGTPSYHVQAMFAANRPDVALPVDLSLGPPDSPHTPMLFATAGVKKDTGEMILKVVNRSDRARTVNIRLGNLGDPLGGGTCLELGAAGLDAENSYEQPRNISPVRSELPPYTLTCTHEFPKFSVTVLRWEKKVAR